ncbi:MAG: hypothetical protein KatS3mg123_0461 [Burkholderiales bacterium]|nr:MAG: hypothetical protein KatS3mg123_0461 [Burkholderiales bacterium]
MSERYVLWFDEVGLKDVERVGGKNASLGEMIGHLAHAGVRVPGGFATTAQAYRDFLAQGGLDRRIRDALARLDVDDIAALTRTGAQIRGWVTEAPFPPALEAQIAEAYQRLAEEGGPELSVAVRSSATAEDLPDASFAGQQETLPQRARPGSGPGSGQARVRLPVQRPGHRLSGPPGLRSRPGGPVGGGAAHGAQRPRPRAG